MRICSHSVSCHALIKGGDYYRLRFVLGEENIILFYLYVLYDVSLFKMELKDVLLYLDWLFVFV